MWLSDFEEIFRLVCHQLDFIQTDNGLEYQRRFLTFLSQAKQEFSLPHHIKHHYIHKSSPNENAVIERSFRTDEEEFFWRLDNQPKDLITLNALYQQYLHCYNSYRPHLGLNMTTILYRQSNENVRANQNIRQRRRTIAVHK